MPPAVEALLQEPKTDPCACPAPEGRAWAILLAGGQGQRLSCLVGRLHADRRPKQFATIIGTRSMLQHTYGRALAHASPDRTLVVITEGQERWALAQLPDVPAENFLIQPRGLDTGPALLFALALLLERDPAATFLSFPTDHFIFPEWGLRRSVARALSALEDAGEEAAILLAARPTGPRGGMGWILPGALVRRSPAPLRRVARFAEKPDPDAARDLLAGGALWNTFIMAGNAGSMHRLIARRHPRAAEGVSLYLGLRRQGAWKRECDRAFGGIEPFNLSSQVLAREPDALLVATLEETHWSDWGTPEGVWETLHALAWDCRFQARSSGKESIAVRTCRFPQCVTRGNTEGGSQ